MVSWVVKVVEVVVGGYWNFVGGGGGDVATDVVLEVVVVAVRLR